jgi:PilZ domain
MSNLDQPRSTARFVSDDVVAATFLAGASTMPVMLRDVSVNGAQIEHAQPIHPAQQGRLLLGTLTANATVIWTRLTAPGRYRSGLRIDERLEIVAAAIRELLARGVIRKGEDTLRRREQARLERDQRRAALSGLHPVTSGPSPADIQRIRDAREWILMFPEDALKWYNRARVTATEDHLRLAGSGHANREDVLAVWEYLERRVGLADVVRVLDAR